MLTFFGSLPVHERVRTCIAIAWVWFPSLLEEPKMKTTPWDWEGPRLEDGAVDAVAGTWEGLRLASLLEHAAVNAIAWDCEGPRSVSLLEDAAVNAVAWDWEGLRSALFPSLLEGKAAGNAAAWDWEGARLASFLLLPEGAAAGLETLGTVACEGTASGMAKIPNSAAWACKGLLLSISISHWLVVPSPAAEDKVGVGLGLAGEDEVGAGMGMGVGMGSAGEDKVEAGQGFGLMLLLGKPVDANSIDASVGEPGGGLKARP